MKRFFHIQSAKKIIGCTIIRMNSSFELYFEFIEVKVKYLLTPVQQGVFM